ncbi:MAG: hypothetical protein Q9157_002105 [Trypethelium eluteriae]
MSWLLGIGYAERSEMLDFDHFNKIGYRNISEHDYLQLFAEGIVVNKPDNAESSEIATGMSPVYDNDSIQAQFCSDPEFVHSITLWRTLILRHLLAILLRSQLALVSLTQRLQKRLLT